MDQEGLWVVAALRGDQNAFTHLVDTYKAPVYNLCYRMLGSAPEAEDAAQETFVRVYTHLKAYDSQQKLSTWILSVAAHYCIDGLRRRRIKWLSLDELWPWHPLSEDIAQPEDEIVERESCAEIKNLLGLLPTEHRLVIVLRYWQDLSYVEIAHIVGTTESAVKSRLHRARQMLAEQVLAQRRLEPRSSNDSPKRKRVVNNAVL